MFDSPLWQETPFDDYAKRYGMTREEIIATYLSVIPLHRGCEYKDAADLAVFLLSDRASDITGQALNVTGGEVVWQQPPRPVY
jgi:sorbitol-6-phosphate 2-dehydrogenase